MTMINDVDWWRQHCHCIDIMKISWTWPWLDIGHYSGGGHCSRGGHTLWTFIALDTQPVERVKPVGVGQWSSYCSEICTPVLHSVSKQQLSNTSTVSFPCPATEDITSDLVHPQLSWMLKECIWKEHKLIIHHFQRVALGVWAAAKVKVLSCELRVKSEHFWWLQHGSRADQQLIKLKVFSRKIKTMLSLLLLPLVSLVY